MRVVVITYGGGNSHRMAAAAVAEHLPDAEVHILEANSFLKSFSFLPIPWVKWCERVYGHLMRKECRWLLNLMRNPGKNVFIFLKRKIVKLGIEYVQKHKPDIIVSCASMVNFAILSIAKKSSIPFLVLMTNEEFNDYCFRLHDRDILQDKKQFRIGVVHGEMGRDEKHFRELSPTLRNAFQYGFGAPIRRSFYEETSEKALCELRREYQIQEDEKVILVMMGGNPGKIVEDYARLFLQMSDQEVDQIVGSSSTRRNIRLICLCGDTTRKFGSSLQQTIRALNHSRKRKNRRVQIHAAPGTSKIAELVSLPEMRSVISKPGGSTFNEMAKKKMPVIYTAVGSFMPWEASNMAFGERRNFGRSLILSKDEEIDRQNLIETLRYTFALHRKMRSDPSLIPEADIDFGANLRQAIHEMVTSSEPTNPSCPLAYRAR